MIQRYVNENTRFNVYVKFNSYTAPLHKALIVSLLKNN